MTLEELKKEYNNILNEWVVKFCEKHGLYFEDSMWVNDGFNKIVEISDYFISIDDIIVDLTTEDVLEERDFFSWYDYCLRLKTIDLDIVTPNLKSYKANCPIISESDIEKLEKAKDNVKNAELLFKAMLFKYKCNE
ncbi:MAG: hypothetical protein M0R03_18910 [Novosphingobium sp.]|nr:hypothetical protein [Novosphingobium sp.]